MPDREHRRLVFSRRGSIIDLYSCKGSKVRNAKQYGVVYFVSLLNKYELLTAVKTMLYVWKSVALNVYQIIQYSSFRQPYVTSFSTSFPTRAH